jgi:hypothetical protein
MYRIKKIYRLTIIDNKKKTVKIFPSYDKAFSFCGNYFVQKKIQFIWSRDLKSILRVYNSSNSKSFKGSTFLKNGFKKKILKNTSIFIDEIFKETEKFYKTGQNINTKHEFIVKLPNRIWKFSSRSYEIGYYRIANYLQKRTNLSLSYGLNYMLDGFGKTPYFIAGRLRHRIYSTTIIIDPIE